MGKNEKLDWLYCFLAKVDELEDNSVMDIPFTCGLSYWNWSKDYDC